MFWAVPITFLAVWIGTTTWAILVGPIPSCVGSHCNGMTYELKPLTQRVDGKIQHRCTWNKHNIYYDCQQCSDGAKWACSTHNDDEDANICDECLDGIAQDLHDLLEPAK